MHQMQRVIRCYDANETREFCLDGLSVILLAGFCHELLMHFSCMRDNELRSERKFFRYQLNGPVFIIWFTIFPRRVFKNNEN